jgi:serine/threonine protein kinase
MKGLAAHFATFLQCLVTSNGTIGVDQLSNFLASLEPSLQSEHMKLAFSQAGLVRDGVVDCGAFTKWVFNDDSDLAMDGKDPSSLGVTPKKGSGKGPVPPAAKKAPPSKGKAPPPPAPKKAPAKKKTPNGGDVPKAAAPPIENAGLSLAEQLERRRAGLRTCGPRGWTKADSATLPSERELQAETLEAAKIVLDLHELIGGTRLGVVDVSNISIDETPDCCGAIPSIGSRPSLGRTQSGMLGQGRFASVMSAFIATAAGSTGVAAKRFACSCAGSEASAGEVAVKIPIAALRSARREADALAAVNGHLNVVELLGMVLPPLGGVADMRVPEGDAGLEALRRSPPLQMLLKRCTGSLFGLVNQRDEWTMLGSDGRRSLLVGAARGLTALHGAGFAHLDVKSHNILVDHQPAGGYTAQICDLGSSYRVGSGLQVPAEGTSGWVAPEILCQPIGAPGEAPPPLEPRLADVFSFGVVIWEVVAGPGANHPLCGLVDDEYCEALAGGRRPTFPEEADSRQVALATVCWELQASRRPSMAEVESRLAADAASVGCQ